MQRTAEPESTWTAVARRIVEGVGTRAEELVLVRGGSDPIILEEVLLAVEGAGATPLPEVVHPDYIRRLLRRTDPAYLAGWDLHRATWLRMADRVISLAGMAPDLADVPASALQAWEGALERLDVVEDERRLPRLVVAVPDPARAAAFGMSTDDLAAVLLPALTVPAAELRTEIERVLRLVQAADSLTLRTGKACVLRLRRAGRAWHSDDGLIDEADIAAGAGVSNLPAGSVYTTVIEESAEGTLWLPRAGPAQNVTLRFEHGRVVDVLADAGADRLKELLARHTGESRRISHMGIGLNPLLREPVGWVLVDEHIHGALFIALGENRYMGGKNASSLNIDFCVPGATILADDRIVVREGEVA